MSLVVMKDNCTLMISWPATCCSGLNRETLKFIVVVYDVEHCYRMLTTPLLAQSLNLRVAIPPYFSSSADQLVVTVHLCEALVSEAGWKTMESLTACAVPYDCDEYEWQQNEFYCEHGPTGRKYNVST